MIDQGPTHADRLIAPRFASDRVCLTSVRTATDQVLVRTPKRQGPFKNPNPNAGVLHVCPDMYTPPRPRKDIRPFLAKSS